MSRRESKQFDSEDSRSYWEGHDAVTRSLDFEADPDGLNAVCHVGAPRWLNAYYAKHQRIVYARLLDCLPRPATDPRALDVGCGAGRWCRLLAERGYAVTGIDLQPTMIESNRSRHPDVEFVCTSIQDYRPAASFDLVSSVTVLQHLPDAEQDRAVERIRGLTRQGAHVIALENVSDRGAHMFANPAEVWIARFAKHGFKLAASQPYDYSPTLRVLDAARGRVGGVDTFSPPRREAVQDGKERPRRRPGLRAFFHALQRAAVVVDDRLEPALSRRRWGLAPLHYGFLFEAG